MTKLQKLQRSLMALTQHVNLQVLKYVKSEIIGAVARELIFLKDFRNGSLT